MVETGLVAVATGAVGVALVNKISDAVGWYFEPRRIVRNARAEAEAELVRAKSNWDVGDLDTAELIKRAEFRSAVEQIAQQANMEAIVSKALSLLREDASPQNMGRDWVVNFFERCRNVSDDDMQELWAKLLAGEANDCGSFSRKSVNVMADLDSQSARVFSTYCRFFGQINDYAFPFVVLDRNNVLPSVYLDQGLDLNALHDLADLSLISTGLNPMVIYVRHHVVDLPDIVKFSYGNQSVDLECPEGRVTNGVTALTTTGIQLASLCRDEQPVEGFFDFIVEEWERLCKGGGIITGGGVVTRYPK